MLLQEVRKVVLGFDAPRVEFHGRGVIANGKGVVLLSVGQAECNVTVEKVRLHFHRSLEGTLRVGGIPLFLVNHALHPIPLMVEWILLQHIVDALECHGVLPQMDVHFCAAQ